MNPKPKPTKRRSQAGLDPRMRFSRKQWRLIVQALRFDAASLPNNQDTATEYWLAEEIKRRKLI